MVTTAPALDAAGRHAPTEAWLDERGIAWTFEPAMALGRIDRAASLANQARLEPLDEDVVERYAADYERGDRFPPLIVYPKGRDGAVVLIGGNHRTAGATKAKRKTHPAYVVTVTDDQVLPLTYEDNRRHGLPPSDEERVLQALHLIGARGLTQDEAAAVVGLSVFKMRQGVGLAKAERRAKEAGVAGWSSLPKTARWRLSSVESDAVFGEAARLAVMHEMGAADVDTLVRQVNAAHDNHEALAIIGETEEALTERPHRRYSSRAGMNTPRARMLEALRIVASLDPIAIVRGCADADQRKVLHDQILRAARVMGTVAEKLTT